MPMNNNEYSHYALSLMETLEQVQNTLPQAKKLGLKAIGIEISLSVAQDLQKALEQYQEPRFCGWPRALVEKYLELERDIPSDVMESYNASLNVNIQG